jgi:hypothetical protein
MIRDVTEFSRTGVASRRVTELDIPVAAWRAAMCHAGRRESVRVRAFLIPPTRRVGPDQQQRRLLRDHPVADHRQHELQQLRSGVVQQQLVAEAPLTGGRR